MDSFTIDARLRPDGTGEWRLGLLPHPQGVVVVLSDGGPPSVFARVGYMRWRSTQWWLPFGMALRSAIDRGLAEAERLNSTKTQEKELDPCAEGSSSQRQ